VKQSSNEGNETLQVVAFTDVSATLRTFLTFLSDQTNIAFHVVTNEVELVDAMRNFSVDVIAMIRVGQPNTCATGRVRCSERMAWPIALNSRCSSCTAWRNRSRVARPNMPWQSTPFTAPAEIRRCFTTPTP